MDRPRTYAYGTSIVLLVVFVLSFLACVSIPISQSITLFNLDIRQADTSIRAGLWGYCVPCVLCTFRHPVFKFSNKSVPFCRDSTVHGLKCSEPRIDWTLKQLFSSDTCPFSPSQSADARICTGVLNDLGNLVPSGLTDAFLIHVFGSFHC